MPARVLISDWKTWEAWSKTGRASGRDIILTESPGVFEVLKGESDILDISAAMSLEESQDLCGRVADLARDWRRVLDERLARVLPGKEPGRIFGRDLVNAMVCMAYHRELLDRAVREGAVLVPYVVSVPGNRLDRMDTQAICPHGVNYFGLSAQAGVPGVEALPLEPAAVAGGGEEERFSLGRIALSLLLKVAATSPSFGYRYLLRLWERLSQAVALQGRMPRHAFIHTANDLLLREIPRLMLNGSSVSRITPAQDKAFAPDGVSLQASLLDVTPPELRAALAPAARKVEDLTNGVLLPALGPMREMAKAETGRYASGRKTVLLSGSMVDPVQVLMTRCFAERGVASVQFQHGGIGLLDLYLKLQFFSDMAVCDGFVCFNAHERDFYQLLTRDGAVTFHVKGARREHGAVLKSAARWAGRRIFGVGKDEKLAIYAPTRFKDGQVLANDVFDMKYWSWMKTLLKESASGADCRFVVKVHQKGLWGYGMPELYRDRKDPLKRVILGGNVEVRRYPQLNYCRFGADLIVVDRATSTIGWALAADVPLLYLETPFCRLLPEVRERIREALLYVDCAEEGWTGRVRDVLDSPVSELRCFWENKRAKREMFVEQYVLGPRDGHKGLWPWLWKVQPAQT